MAYKDIKEFIKTLEKCGELRRIGVEVDPVLEITEIADRVMKGGGPALLFENVKGSGFPVFINAFGSCKRMSLALGVDDLDAVGAEIESLLELSPSGRLLEALKALPKLKRLKDAFPKTVGDGPCQEVVIEKDPSLEILPALKCWPLDGGRYITLPLVVTRNPETGVRNVGMYRMQVFDAHTAGMHWHAHKGGAWHYRLAEKEERRLEVAVALGPDPAITYAATAPLPDEFDEMIFAGFLRKRPVRMVKCVTVGLEVPADSQFVLEGYLEPGERRMEGPFGDHTGFYSLADRYPVFHLTCITHQRDPVYPATVVGPPPMEDGFMGKATERIFLPLIKRQLPEVVDINLPVEGVFHNLAIVAIEKKYPGHAKKVMHALWGMGQMMFTKVIVVVEAGVDVQNPGEVLWIAGNNIDPRRDVIFSEGPADALDHAAQAPGLGTKMGIDATGKWREEGFDREWPDIIEMSDEVKKKIDAIWGSLGIDS
jgi:4-hydroxy-3-polyprenylbenzoate decarboxylase